jgi:hypothetical protein
MTPIEAAHHAFRRQFTFNMLMICKIKNEKSVKCEGVSYSDRVV